MGLFEAFYVARSNAHTAARYSRPGDPVQLIHVFMGGGVAVWLVTVFLVSWAI
jgi:hypothetical protein